MNEASRGTLESATSLLGEFRRLWTLARRGWLNGARPWLGIAAAFAAALVPTFLHFHILSPELWRSGAVYASLPLPMELARLPMSLFFPTPYLPMWAACAQLLVVVGLGELILGRWLTITVVFAGHFGSTLVARALLDSVHGHALGLAPALAHVLDTGPSAATTAIGACLLVSVRMNRGAALLSVSLLVAAFFVRGVDGVEHMVALAIGVLAGVAFRVATSTSAHIKPPWSIVHLVQTSDMDETCRSPTSDRVAGDARP
ncbi:MAG: hypothetical protein WAM64_04815 [Acidimicrobiales bacterium]